MIKRFYVALVAMCLLSPMYVIGQTIPVLGIAHVAFQVSDLEKSSQQYTQYYGFETAFTTDNGRKAAFLKINDQQFIKLVAIDRKTSTKITTKTADNRLIEVALQVSDLKLTVKLLKQKGFQPSAIYTAATGSLVSTLIDPDGHKLVFLEYAPQSLQAKTRGKYLGKNRLSNRLQHVGITVTNEAAANALYGAALGFKDVWRESRTDGGPDAWVAMQMPGSGRNYIEYILINDMEPTRDQLGSMHHLCLLTDDIHQTYQQLLANGLPTLERHKPRIGRSKRWLLNIHDFDGTRTEFMEEDQADQRKKLP